MERIEALELEHRDLMLAFKVQHSQGEGKALMRDQDAYFAKLGRAERDGSTMPRDIMLRFPGMPNYKKRPVS